MVEEISFSIMSTNPKRTVYVGKFRVFLYSCTRMMFGIFSIQCTVAVSGGLAEEVDEKVLHAAFIPFGDIMDIQIPLDYETEKHRGFAFVEFESAEDAAAAIDNMVRIWRLKGTYDFWTTSKLYVRCT